MKIQTRMVLMVLVPFCLIQVGAILLFGNIGQSFYARHIHNDISHELDMASSHINEHFRSRFMRLRHISETPVIRYGKISDKLDYIGFYEKNYPHVFERLYYVDKNGVAAKPSGQRIDVSDRDYMPVALSGKDVVSKILISKDTKTHILVQMVPVFDATRKVVGGILATVEIDALLESLKNVEVGKGGVVILSDRSGGILTNCINCNPGDEFGFIGAQHDDDMCGFEPARKAFMNGTIQGEVKCNGVSFMMQRISLYDMGWDFVVAVRKDYAFADFYRINNFLYIILAGTFIVLLLQSIFTLRAFVRPVNELADIHRRFGRGETDVRACVGGGEELAHLSDSFNRMADRIEEEFANRVAAQRELSETEDRYRYFIENANDAYWQTDADGALVYVSEQIENITGYKPEKLLGTIVYEQVNNPAQAKMDFESTRDNYDRAKMEIYSSTHADGHIVYSECVTNRIINESGKFLGIWGISRDVTDRVLAEKALRESESRYRMLVESTADVIWEADAEFNCTFISPQVITHVGYTAEEIVGINIKDSVLPEFMPIFEDALKRSLVDKVPFHNLKLKARMKDGGELWYLCSGAPVYGDGGELVGFRGVNRNIDDYVKQDEEYQRTEERYGMILNHLFLFIGFLDPEGRLLVANKTSLDWVHLTLDDVSGQYLWDLPWWNYSIDVQKRLKYNIKRAVNQEFVREQVVHYSPDGNRIVMDFTLKPIFDEGGNVVQLLAEGRDITDFVEVQDRLKESEEMYRLLYDNVGVYLSIFDRAGICLLMNKEAAETFNGKPDDFIGYNVDKLHPLGYELYRKRIVDVIDSGVPKTYEDKISFPSGERFLLSVVHPVRNAAGKVFAAQVLSHDFTEIKNTEQALRESEESLRITLNSIGDGVIATNADARVARMNPVACELTGWSESDAVGERFSRVFKLVDGDTGEQLNDISVEVISTGRIQTISESAVLRARDGSDREVSDSGAPILNDEGRIVGAVIVFRDVTEQRLIEKQLRQNQKMESIGRLAGGIAHDFNNMLGGIIGASDLLVLKLRDDDELAKYARLVSTTAERAAALTGKLLAFSRAAKVVSRPIDANRVVRDALDILERSVNKKVVIKAGLCEGNPVIYGDAGQLQNAVINLGINARDAMPSGGEITVFTSLVRLDEKYCAESQFSLSPGAFFKVSIRDQGVGIPPENLERIFEPFFTTKDVGKGTGLGLSAVYGTIKDHKGAINVYSELSRGTEFNLYFPLAADDNAALALGMIESASEESELKGAGRILLVDDEVSIREAAGSVLTDLGFTVDRAGNGRECLDIFKEDPEKYDLIILDVVMPEMDGEECFRELVRIKPDVRVVMSSGYSRDARIDNLFELGLRGFVKKPFKIRELMLELSKARE